MNTVIVPVDFTSTSTNAARYAVKFLSTHGGVNVILYHHYTKPAEQNEVQQKLADLKATLLQDDFAQIELLPHSGENFLDDLEKAVRHRMADLLVMGITERNSLTQFIIGSDTVKMAQRRVCPVLVVPEHAEYRQVRNVMLASDFKDTLNTTPSVPIIKFLEIKRPHLHVVNVDPEHYIALTEEYEKEKETFNKMFADYSPEYYFMRLYDVDEAINLFATEKNIDVIIAIHRNESFLERVFKGSRTKNLSKQSKLPVLVVHE
jgi:nucleotide-binding universal stress UspA family protein